MLCESKVRQHNREVFWGLCGWGPLQSRCQRIMPVRVSQDGIDTEPGNEHSSLEEHQVLGSNEF